MKQLGFLHIFVAVFTVITKFFLVHGSAIYQTIQSEDGFCYKKLFTQPVSSDGCETTFVENAFCRGQCRSAFSYLTTNEAYINCSVCQPEHESKILVKVRCNEGKISIIEVGKVESCRCMLYNCQRKLPNDEAKLQSQSETFIAENFKKNQNLVIKRNRRLLNKIKKCMKKTEKRRIRCLAKLRNRLESYADQKLSPRGFL